MPRSGEATTAGLGVEEFEDYADPIQKMLGGTQYAIKLKTAGVDFPENLKEAF